MRKRIEFKLSVDSVGKAIEELENIKLQLKDKCREFCEELIKQGITIAESNCGEYSGYIGFEIRSSQPIVDGWQALFVAFDKETIMREWLYGYEIRFASVSPLLMAEFGSGFLAEVLLPNIPNVGQGTFPHQRHAFDDGGWHWQDVNNGEWHDSVGEQPTHPVYLAVEQMKADVNKVGKSIFGEW